EALQPAVPPGAGLGALAVAARRGTACSRLPLLAVWARRSSGGLPAGRPPRRGLRAPGPGDARRAPRAVPLSLPPAGAWTARLRALRLAAAPAARASSPAGAARRGRPGAPRLAAA